MPEWKLVPYSPGPRISKSDIDEKPNLFIPAGDGCYCSTSFEGCFISVPSTFAKSIRLWAAELEQWGKSIDPQLEPKEPGAPGEERIAVADDDGEAEN